MNCRVQIFAAIFGIFAISAAFADEAQKPNIVFVLCDDLGYGDIQSLNPERGKILTPAVDRLASEGMIFTDAHSGSSVCSPTRYGLLTGRYSWRTRLQKGVVQGFADCLIAPGRLTAASFLKQQGYHTAILGKWHLDFQYEDPETGKTLTAKTGKDLPPVGSKIPDGPLQHGFDYFHGFHHAGSMKSVIENDTVIMHDDVINMLPRLSSQAVEYIDGRAQADRKQPFFLYVPFGSPHTPIVPTKPWQGKSGLGSYADFVMETDDGFRGILDALDRNGFTENTLVVFSSDNGCSKVVKIKKLQEQGHYPSAHMRGSKADLWDGGHRVPFIVRWPGKVKAGSTSDQLICLTDWIATCSDLLKTDLPDGTAEDSVSFLPAFSGDQIPSTRKGIVHHSVSGHFAYRQGNWKLLLARGSGGWSGPNENAARKAGAPIAQLYNLQSDPAETNNLYEKNPEIAERLLAQLTSDVNRGRSTDGAESKNDLPIIDLWKSEKKPKR